MSNNGANPRGPFYGVTVKYTRPDCETWSAATEAELRKRIMDEVKPDPLDISPEFYALLSAAPLEELIPYYLVYGRIRLEKVGDEGCVSLVEGGQNYKAKYNYLSLHSSNTI